MTDQCSQLCPDADAAGTVLTQCDDGSYCCGAGNTDCCDSGGGTHINKSNGQILISGQITKSVPPATAAASTISPSATAGTKSTAPSSPPPSSSSSISSTVTAGPLTTSSTPPSASETSSSSGLSGGAKAGIAIGVVAGLALIGGLSFLLFRERRKRKALQGASQGEQYAHTGSRSELHPGNEPPPQEMSTYEDQNAKTHMRRELPDGQGRPGELPDVQGRPQELYTQ
ncbi:MAG: hypothetical protein LQ338_006219 [Usnochroma carphineum]|nr:MAG: hypothetical protein LQ338_006219 [Usnochroma carphineum]